MSDKKPLIELHQLSLGYGSKDVLEGATFSVFPGERVALVGMSGVGKSSLINSLAGFSAITSGSASVLGVDAASLAQRKNRGTRRSIAIVMQDANLVEELTVFENVLIGGLYRYRVPRVFAWSYSAQDRHFAKENLESLGLGDFLKVPAKSLSGGQARRVAVARALQAKPLVLLADEPTASLDAESAELVLNSLKALSAETASLVSFHNLDQAVAFGTRVIAMRNGGIVLDSAANSVSAEDLGRAIGPGVADKDA